MSNYIGNLIGDLGEQFKWTFERATWVSIWVGHLPLHEYLSEHPNEHSDNLNGYLSRQLNR